MTCEETIATLRRWAEEFRLAIRLGAGKHMPSSDARWLREAVDHLEGIADDVAALPELETSQVKP